ncbi:hypothetical protein BDQ17DRAFT_1500206 [Cyathus striatus]|nr:hypothetical protein BDQ17DRAFT_1500206 [Cyathus striatus]
MAISVPRKITGWGRPGKGMGFQGHREYVQVDLALDPKSRFRVHLLPSRISHEPPPQHSSYTRRGKFRDLKVIDEIDTLSSNRVGRTSTGIPCRRPSIVVSPSLSYSVKCFPGNINFGIMPCLMVFVDVFQHFFVRVPPFGTRILPGLSQYAVFTMHTKHYGVPEPHAFYFSDFTFDQP